MTSSSVNTPISLRELPRLRTRHLGRVGGLLRPGTQRSPLLSLGERFVMSAPGFPTMLVTRNMDDVRELLSHEDFSLGQLLRRYSTHDALFGTQTLIFLDGEDHRRERKVLAPPFQSKALQTYEDLMADVVRSELPTWPVGEPFPFVDVGYRLALGVLLGVVFGDMPPERMTRLKEALGRWFGAIESPGFLAVTAITLLAGGYTPPYRPLLRGQAEVDAIIAEEIAERRAAPDDRRDVLSRYVGTELDPHDDGTLVRNMRGMLLAGYETTAITLGWIAAMLTTHPRAMAELDAAVDAGDDARLDAYLDAVVAETMRMRPVSPFTGRRALRDTVLNDVRIPEGAVVMVPILLIHESPEHYPNPEEFRPERFLDGRIDGRTWLTFGGGRHRCLGAHFALLEARILFRTVLRHYRLDHNPGPVEPPRRYHPGISPAHNALVTLRPR
ncbi:cytochrome P450 [Nocardia sp. CY41]|uniref:cytochrome P450 n=1 Tax=Nocardia sp. CY41 TaxID=2608686 RepID=UPI00135A2417|nr:cytochrome P450 [Nocardia sp. CY41]